MTISSEIARVDYVGAGTVGPFTVPFYFLNATDLVVKKKLIADGTVTTLTYGGDYTVAGAGVLAGGSITLAVALPPTYTLAIIRDPDFLQETDYVENDKFPAESHERALDKLTMQVQRLAEISNRSLKLPEVEPDAFSEFPTRLQRLSKYIGFDSVGNPALFDPITVITLNPGFTNVFDYMTPEQIDSVVQRDGLVDVSAALAAAFADGVGYMPSGTYTCASSVSVPSANRLQILGTGSSETEFLFTNPASAGLVVTYSDVKYPPSIEGVTMLIDGDGSAGQIGLNVTGPAAVATTYMEGVRIRDVVIRPVDPATDAWNMGIYCSELWYPVIRDITIKGGITSIHPYTTARGIWLNNVQAPTLAHLYLQHVTTGVYEDGISLGEGLIITHFEMVGVTNGIDIGNGVSTPIPGTYIGEGHVNAAAKCILLSDRVQSTIANMLLYKTPATALSWTGIELSDSDNNFIDNVFFGGNNGVGSGNGNGVVLSNADQNVIGHLSSDYFSVAGSMVVLGGTSKFNTIDAKKFTTGANGTAFTPIGTSGFTGTDNRISSVEQAITVLTANSATPSVANAISGFFQTANTLATTITNFTGGYTGQVITILVNDALTTFQHNGVTIALETNGVNKLAAAGQIYTFRNFGAGLWRQVSGAHNALVNVTVAATDIESKGSAGALLILSRVRNDTGAAGVAAFGFNVANTAGAEASVSKAAIGLERNSPNGEGDLVVYLDNAGDGNSVAVADELGRFVRASKAWKPLFRVMGKQGAAVASANDLTLGGDGNYFQITGATQINRIINTNWEGGSRVLLKFNGAPTVKHNQAAGTTQRPIKLVGAVDFVASADDTLELVYDATDATWYEVGRSVI